MQTKNYTFGLLPPTENRQLVLDQLAGAHRYRNKLVEIELQRRGETDAVVRQFVPGLLECESELATIKQRIEETLAAQKGRNQRARAKTDDTACRAVLKELKDRRKVLAARRKELRRDGFDSPACQEALAAVNDAAASAVRAARASCGVFWGSYLLVEQAADGFRKGAPPVFRGYRGEGRIGVQIQGGADWEAVSSGRDTRLRIIHAPQAQQRFAKSGKPLPMPGAKRRAQQYRLSIRVGSEGREPVWATWPLILHRPIPEDAKVMWAVVQRRIVAGKERWSLTLSVRADEEAFRRPDLATRGACGIDVGYRAMPSGELRVAYLVDRDGREQDFRLPAEVLSALDKVVDLQSIRDQRHNDARADLREWLDANPHPAWLDADTDTMASWRRLSRLDQLVVKWRQNRFDGDEAILGRLEAWRTKERHLWQYQENMRDQALARRKDLYRCFAGDVARRYRLVFAEKLDLRELHDVLAAPEDREVPTPIREAARRANLSLLRQCLREAVSDWGEVDPKQTTQKCHACGHVCDFDAAGSLWHTCGQCGLHWDQDANAARNILASGEVVLKARESLAPVAPQGDAVTQSAPNKLSRSQRLIASRKRGARPLA